MSTRRITKEYAELSEKTPEGFIISLPPNESIHTWHVTILPPAESAYHPGRFGLVMTLPADYPFKPPVVRFVTRIYHPNVTNDSLGNVCLGILKSDNWKPSTKIVSVLEHVRGLLVEPAPDDPLEERIAEEFKRDRATFDKNAKAAVQKYALVDPVFPPN
jgi:ubiquitin-protein ligase